MELVYVVKRYDLFDLDFPHGFHTGKEDGKLSRYLERIRDKGFFVERRHAEEDSGFKQIIPYSLVLHDNRILVLKRTASQGESRLHNKRSIGVGGHINPVDEEGQVDERKDVLLEGCIREIEEELVIDEPYETLPVGIINDESNPVGSVHFGVVFLVKVEWGRVKVKETSMMSADFMDLRELQSFSRQEDANFETWSSSIIQSLDFLPL